MLFSKREFDKIMSDKSKKIIENIAWEGDKKDSETVKFRVSILSQKDHNIFADGSYNRYLERLSYKIIHKGIGRRIYGLDMGKDHKNPDRTIVKGDHIHEWDEDFGDKIAYSANNIITSKATNPIEVWKEFCREAQIDFQGIMEEIPLIQIQIDYDLGGIFL